jgi:hypothetical protein
MITRKNKVLPICLWAALFLFTSWVTVGVDRNRGLWRKEYLAALGVLGALAPSLYYLYSRPVSKLPEGVGTHEVALMTYDNKWVGAKYVPCGIPQRVGGPGNPCPLIGDRNTIGEGEVFNMRCFTKDCSAFALQAKHEGKWIAAENAGGGFVNANRDAIAEWEHFTLEKQDQKRDAYAIRTNNRRNYWTVDPQTKIISASATSIGPSETFIIQQLGS